MFLGRPPQIVEGYFDIQPITIFVKTRRSIWTRSFQVSCAVMNFIGRSNRLTLIRSLASNRYECSPRFFSRNVCLRAHWPSSKQEKASRSPLGSPLSTPPQSEPPSELLVATRSGDVSLLGILHGFSLQLVGDFFRRSIKSPSL